MDPVHPTRARGWVLGPEVGLHPRFPGPSSEPNGDELRWMKVWYRFRVPCVNNGLVWAGGRKKEEKKTRQARVGGLEAIVGSCMCFPTCNVRHSTKESAHSFPKRSDQTLFFGRSGEAGRRGQSVLQYCAGCMWIAHGNVYKTDCMHACR